MNRKTRKHVGLSFAAMMALVAAASFGAQSAVTGEKPTSAPTSASQSPWAPAPTETPEAPENGTQPPYRPNPDPGTGTDTPIQPDSATPAPSPTPSGDVVPVTRVVDGDTIRVQLHGQDTQIRIVGLDTPETVHPREPVGCYGPEASAEAKRLLTGQTVQLVYDTSQGTTDQYGRTLAYVVFPDGTDFAEHMIRNGFGESYLYRGNLHDRWEAYEDAEAAAKSTGFGMWSAC